MTFDFIEDLDEYFCEKYANYDHICILKGYEMPKMQTTARGWDRLFLYASRVHHAPRFTAKS